MNEVKTIIYMSDEAEYGVPADYPAVCRALSAVAVKDHPFHSIDLADEDSENYGPVTTNVFQVTAVRSADGVERALNS